MSTDQIDELTIEKLKFELEKLKEPWWKKTIGKLTAAIVGTLGAAIVTVSMSYLNVKSELENKPENIKIEILKSFTEREINNNFNEEIVNYSVGYATGVLKSESGNKALEQAIKTGNKEEVAKMVQNVVAQTVTKIVKKVE